MKELLSIIVAIVFLSGCASEEADRSEEMSPSEKWMYRLEEVRADNKITCTVNGVTWTGKGKLVAAGGGVIGDSLYVSIGAFTEKNGENIGVLTGETGLPFQVGTYSLPDRRGRYTRAMDKKAITTDNSKESFYGLFYATSENDSACRLGITISSIDTLNSDSTDYTWVKMTGKFNFRAAYVPGGIEHLSDTCTSESVQRLRTQGAEFPKYNAEICDAEKAEINAAFEVFMNFSNKDKRISID